MHELIAWCGFFGAWLLVAGPVHQASIELREEALESDALEGARATFTPAERVSPWWWLLPPVYYVLARRSGRRQREAAFASMTPQQREQLVGFLSKAQGWLAVAAGASLIAVKETWELHEVYEWPTWLFWVLVAVAAFVAVGNTAAQGARRDKVLGAPTEPG